MGAVLVELFRRYNWKKTNFVTSTGSNWLDGGLMLGHHLQNARIEVRWSSPFDPGKFQPPTMTLIKKLGFRIIILMAYDPDINNVADVAKQMKMTSMGWAWLLTEPRGGTEQRLADHRAANDTNPQAPAKNGDHGRARAHAPTASTFQGWLYLAPVLQAKGIFTFAQQVSKYGKDFGSIVPAESVHLEYSAALHDAILLYARAATKILDRGGDLLDGQAVTQMVRSLKFAGVGGTDVALNTTTGDRIVSYEVRSYVVRANDVLDSISIGTYNSTTQEYSGHENEVTWPGNTVLVPVDTAPKNDTSDDTQAFIYAGATGVALLVIGALLVYNIRKHRQRVKEFLIVFFTQEANLIIEQVVELVRSPVLFSSFFNPEKQVDIVGDVYSVIYMSQFKVHCETILKDGHSWLFTAFVICTVPAVLSSLAVFCMRARLLQSIYSNRNQEELDDKNLGRAYSHRAGSGVPSSSRRRFVDIAMLFKLAHDQKDLHGMWSSCSLIHCVCSSQFMAPCLSCLPCLPYPVLLA